MLSISGILLISFVFALQFLFKDKVLKERKNALLYQYRTTKSALKFRVYQGLPDAV